MERLAAVDQTAKGKTSFKFQKNRLQIAVHTGIDLFETGTFKVPNLEKMKARFRKDTEPITGILDEMLKHEHLFGCRPASGKSQEDTASE